MVPFPRYLAGKCCDDSTHITNFGEDTYPDEVLKVSQVVRAAYSAAKPPGEYTVFSLSESDLAFTAEAETTGGESPIWADPVHFMAEVYGTIAGDLLSRVAPLPDDGEDRQGAKRQRIDSVAPPTICIAPQSRGRPPIPAWLMGRSEQPSRGGRESGTGSGRGSRRGGFNSADGPHGCCFSRAGRGAGFWAPGYRRGRGGRFLGGGGRGRAINQSMLTHFSTQWVVFFHGSYRYYFKF